MNISADQQKTEQDNFPIRFEVEIDEKSKRYIEDFFSEEERDSLSPEQKADIISLFYELYGVGNEDDILMKFKIENIDFEEIKSKLKEKTKEKIINIQKTSIGKGYISLFEEKNKEDPPWTLKIKPFQARNLKGKTRQGDTNNERKVINLYGLRDMDQTLIHEINHIKVENFIENLKKFFKGIPILEDILDWIIKLNQANEERASILMKNFTQRIEQNCNEKILTDNSIIYPAEISEIFTPPNELTEDEKKIFPKNEFADKDDFFDYLSAIKHDITILDNGERKPLPVNLSLRDSVLGKLSKSQKKAFAAYEIKKEWNNLKEGFKGYRPEHKREEISCRILEILFLMEKNNIQNPTLYNDITKKIEHKVKFSLKPPREETKNYS